MNNLYKRVMIIYLCLFKKKDKYIHQKQVISFDLIYFAFDITFLY